jgi:predicted ATPase
LEDATIIRANFHIITGGPGSGKTSIIEALREGGYRCVDEVGRQIIREQVLIGGNALHWGDRKAFLELMLSRSMQDYEFASRGEGPVFFDRGIAEFAGYCRLTGMPVPPHVERAAQLFRYAPTIFVTPPWPEIFVNDTERKQDFREAIATCDAVVAACREAGYMTVEIPKVSVADRAEFILGHINAGDSASSA